MQKLSRNEATADIIFFIASATVSAIAIFIFDIHWNFYPGGELFPPARHVFSDATPYYIGIPLGGILGFLLLKAINYAFLKEEEEHHGHRKKSVAMRVKK